MSNEITLQEEYSTLLTAAVNYRRRAESAEARAAELAEYSQGLKESVKTLRAELETCTEANHILVDASKRLTIERDEARRQLDALHRTLSEAFNEGDGAYRP